MPLPSLLRTATPKPERKPRKAAAPAVDDDIAIQSARTRARRRLIGAVVLLAVGIVGFPLVFETQPRPVALDTPITIAGKAEAPSQRVQPAPQPAAEPDVITERAELVAPAKVAAEQATPPRAAAGEQPAPPRMAAAEQPVPPRAAAAEQPALPKAAAEPPSAPKRIGAEPPPKRSDAASAPRADDGSRAQALLEGAASSASGAAKVSRYVVQAGAYTDAGALRDARAKVEKLGLKTYTQDIVADGARRTRVRTGPYASRDEADAAAARIRAAGMQVSILAL